MAYLEVEMLAIMILQKFRVVVSPGYQSTTILHLNEFHFLADLICFLFADHPGDYEPLMFLGMRDGLPVRVQRR